MQLLIGEITDLIFIVYCIFHPPVHSEISKFTNHNGSHEQAMHLKGRVMAKRTLNGIVIVAVRAFIDCMVLHLSRFSRELLYCRDVIV